MGPDNISRETVGISFESGGWPEVFSVEAASWFHQAVRRDTGLARTLRCPPLPVIVAVVHSCPRADADQKIAQPKTAVLSQRSPSRKGR